jgi:hypothetical protein
MAVGRGANRVWGSTFAEQKNGSGGGDLTILAANPRGLIANVTFPNGVTLPLGAHSSDSNSGGTLCDSSDIPELPVRQPPSNDFQ